MKRSSHDLQMVVESYDVFNLHCIRQLKKLLFMDKGLLSWQNQQIFQIVSYKILTFQLVNM